MKIGLNATCFSSRPSGAKQRFVGIYNELFKLMPNDTFLVYEPVDFRVSELFNFHDNVKFIPTSMKSSSRYSKFIYGIFFWKRIFDKEKFDIFETFNFPLFKGKSELSYLTVHDIRGYKFENSFLKRFLYKFLYSYSLKKADLVITVSEYMKSELLKVFPNLNIKVLVNGVNTNYLIEKFEDYSLKKNALFKDLKIPNDFMLTVGHFEPRKNYQRLIRAFKKISEIHGNISLVIVGNDSGSLREIKLLLKKLNIEKKVFILQSISDNDLEILYRNALFFVFPSIYEGFGIPILEAKKYDVLCLLSDIKVFREIGGLDCQYFDPYDENEIASAINDAIEQKFSLISMKFPQKYTFNQIAYELRSIYKESIC